MTKLEMVGSAYYVERIKQELANEPRNYELIEAFRVALGQCVDWEHRSKCRRCVRIPNTPAQGEEK